VAVDVGVRISVEMGVGVVTVVVMCRPGHVVGKSPPAIRWRRVRHCSKIGAEREVWTELELNQGEE
jgi:hypothetical protein